MKKIILASLCLASACTFTGCVSEEDDIFDASAPVRLEQAAETYTERLAASAGGWAMEYYPTTETSSPKGNGYLLLAKFYPNLSVTVGMKNQFCLPANEYMEDTSSWEVITDNGPVLTFDTYNNCLHTFSSPDDVPGTPGLDETGVGLEGDYEFVMIDVPEDGEFVMLKGKKRGTYVRMTRLPEGTDFQTYIDDVENFSNTVFSASAPNVCMLTMGDSISKLANGSTGIFNIYPYEGDAISDESYHPFMMTKRGDKYYLRFRDALVGPDETEEQEFVYDSERDLFTGVEHPEYLIEGDLPHRFFASAMSEGVGTWMFNSSSDMSDNIRERYQALASSMSTERATLRQVSFGYADGSYICTIAGSRRGPTGGTTNIYYSYKFALTETENGCTLQYQEPADETSSNMLGTFPAIADLLNVFNAQFTITTPGSRFNMNQLHLAAEGGTEITLTIN